MPKDPEKEKLEKKRSELFEKLMGNPTEAELRRLQLHIDTIEKWRILAGEGHDDTDHGHQGEHEHDHHS